MELWLILMGRYRFARLPKEPSRREYLTHAEVASLLRAAKESPRYGARNYAMIFIAYRHGFRAGELVDLRVSDLDLRRGTIYCRRAKGSQSSVHPMKEDDVRALEALGIRKGKTSGYVFQSERGEKMTHHGFCRVVSQAAEQPGLPVKPYAHLLRHSCGYYLANRGCERPMPLLPAAITARLPSTLICIDATSRNTRTDAEYFCRGRRFDCLTLC